MSKVETVTCALPNISQKTDRNYVHIRSVIYKKWYSNVNKELQKNKEGYDSLRDITHSSASGIIPIDQPKSAALTYREPSKSHIIHHNHKITINKKAKGLNRNLHTSSLKYISNTQLHNKQKFDGKNASSDQPDYFDLLRDESRKPFRRTDFEGVDEFYTNEMVMSRIYNQGFREPTYYSTLFRSNKLEVPDEKTIKESYMLKISPLLSSMENEKTLITHVLGGTMNNITYIESVVDAAKKELEEKKKEKKQLKEEIDNLNENFSEEIKKISQEYIHRFKSIEDNIQNDTISKQTEGFKMQKKLVLLKKEKIELEKSINEAALKLNKLEQVLYGTKIFELNAVPKELDNIPDMNLRCERSALMKNSLIIH